MERLEAEQLIGRNRRHALPVAVQRIAVISSEKSYRAAGFSPTVAGKRLWLPVRLPFVSRRHAGPNGRGGDPSTQKAERRRAHFDCAAIIRGGGAKLDLAAFDGYELCKAVAGSTLPVLTGITMM